jgi:hypothetical protein
MSHDICFLSLLTVKAAHQSLISVSMEQGGVRKKNLIDTYGFRKGEGVQPIRGWTPLKQYKCRSSVR